MSAALVSPTVLGGSAIAIAVAAYIYQRERRGDRLTSALLLLALLVVDSALFPKGGTEDGIFIVPIHGLQFPLLFLVPMGLLAIRVAAGRWRPTFTVSGLCWLGFLGWVIAEAYAGHVRLNATPYVDEQAKILVYFGVIAVLVAGVPARQWLGRRGIPFVVAWCAPVALILVATKTAGVSLDGTVVPGLVTGVQTGQMGADCATVFVTLGLFGLALALTKPVGQRRGVLPAIVLIVSPAFTGQRASLIGALVGLVMLFGVGLSRPGRGIFHVPARERTGVVVVVLLVAAAFAGAAVAGHGYKPANSGIAHSFTSQGKANSATSRVNQWNAAEGLIKQEPILGHGLGYEYNYVEPVKDSPSVLLRSDLTHDIFLDTLLREGAIGCFLLVIALLATLIQGVRFLRLRVGGEQLAAVGMAATAALGGWIARGTVESAFEKDRLAMALGVIVGLASSVARARLAAREHVAARPGDLRLPGPGGVTGPAPWEWSGEVSHV